jgi:hypothetical protein
MMVADEAGAEPAARISISTTDSVPNAEKQNFTPQVEETTSAGLSHQPETTNQPQAAQAAPPVETVHYGLTGAALPAVQPDTAQEMLKKLVQFLGQTIDSAATLDVRTYTSSQMSNVTLSAAGAPLGADLRALTVIKILGDIEQVVPVQDGEIDHELWEIHQETVRQAQASRNDLIRSAMSAAASLANLRLGR